MIVDEKKVIWQEMSNIFPKEESTKSLIAHNWKDEFLCTIWNIKWFKFPHGCILHSKIFPTSTHMPKSELKRRSYGPDKLKKKNQLLSSELCRDKLVSRTVLRPVLRRTCVATSLLCRNQKRCRNLKKAKK